MSDVDGSALDAPSPRRPQLWRGPIRPSKAFVDGIRKETQPQTNAKQKAA